MYMYITVDMSLSKIEEHKCEIAKWQQFLKHKKYLESISCILLFNIVLMSGI